VSEKADSQLVSCLCVTRNKPHKLRRAIQCFRAQSYANKELVIVAEDDDKETLATLEHYRSERHRDILIRVVPVSPKMTLGELRNHAIEIASGEYFCQWDDDDWYHVERITRQLAAVTKAHQSAGILTNWFMFDVSSKQAYLSHVRLWEGSIICKRSIIGENLCYPSMSRMEDTFFVNDLVRTAGVLPQIAPTLYIYEVHSNNTWSARHFERVLAQSQALSKETSALVDAIMSGTHSVADASGLLDSGEVLSELRYVSASTLPTKADLAQYLAETSGPG
jgi:glycosyltransferase involved in cell wall biosynthesis